MVGPSTVTADGSANAGAGTGEGAGTSAAALTDLSRLPPFVPAAVATGHAWDLDEVERLLDSYHQSPQDALGPAIAAVVSQPGSAVARYLLACALAASGRHDDARTVLQALRAAKNCPSCTDALLNAPVDPECSFGPGEVAVAKGLKPSPIRVATRAVLGSLNSGNVAAATPYLDASRPAQFSIVGLECDPGTQECGNTVPHSRKEIIELIRGAGQKDFEEYRAPTRLFCDQECCGGPNPSHSHAPGVHVTEMCFRPDPRPLFRSLSGGADG